MNERIRKILVFMTLPIAVIWGIYNLPSGESETPVEPEDPSVEEIRTVTATPARPADPRMINVAQRETEPWGSDPFRCGRVTSEQPRRNNVNWILRGIIFNASDPLAYINGKAVRVGDTIDQARVKAINRQTVVIDYQGREIELSVRKG
jgi:hypothetical protein